MGHRSFRKFKSVLLEETVFLDGLSPVAGCRNSDSNERAPALSITSQTAKPFLYLDSGGNSKKPNAKTTEL